MHRNIYIVRVAVFGSRITEETLKILHVCNDLRAAAREVRALANTVIVHVDDDAVAYIWYTSFTTRCASRRLAAPWLRG